MSQSFCQASPVTKNAGQIISDRSKYLQFGSSFFKDGLGQPALPSEWSQLTNQAVFVADGTNQMYQGSLGVAFTDNGYGTWKPDDSIKPTIQPVLNQIASNSTDYAMYYDTPAVIMQQGPSCQNGVVTTDEGFTPLCSDGTAPVCNSSTGEISCPNIKGGSGWRQPDPVYINNKYALALQNKFFVNQRTDENGGDWSKVAVDLADCGGVPCGCSQIYMDKDLIEVTAPLPGAAPVVYSNNMMSDGLFSYASFKCLGGQPEPNAIMTFPSAPAPVYYDSAETPTCPIGLAAACTTQDATVDVVKSETHLYPLCQFQSGNGGTYPMTPLCSDQTVAVWSSTENAYMCGSTKQMCPDGSQPIDVVAAACSDGKSQAVCVTQPECHFTGFQPSVPEGFTLKAIQDSKGNWTWVAQPPPGSNQSQAPLACSYFGAKTTDMCACNCFVDMFDNPIAEGLATIDSSGNITCPDPANTKMQCAKPIVFPSCNDPLTKQPTGALPMCANGKRATYDTTLKKVVCADNSTPTCRDNLIVGNSDIVCADSIDQTGQLSMEPVKCVSKIAGGACVPLQSIPAIISNDQTTVSCPDGYTLSCPGFQQQDITAQSKCNGQVNIPMCIPTQNLCGTIYGMPDFGMQAIAPPTDTEMLTNQGILFCSSAEGMINSCDTILQSYFPEFDGPPGSQIQANSSPAPPFLLPDPLTAGALSQGVCLTQNLVPNQSSAFTCAQATNPPTALQNWNTQGENKMMAVPVGVPFPLTKQNGSYPTQIYFQPQAQLGDYDSGLVYYLNQSCAVDSSGACTATHIGGVAQANGEISCPIKDEGVHVVQEEGDKVNSFVVECKESKVRPHVIEKQDHPTWAYPERFQHDLTKACAQANHVLTSVDEQEPLAYDETTGIWKGTRTQRAAVCVPKENADDVKAALGANLPNQPCMNQPGIAPGINYPGDGPIGSIFKYDNTTGACSQQPVCENGVCNSNLRARSLMDYHQGLTIMNTAVQFPNIYQSDTNFPPSMFGDLGPPGNGQVINPALLPFQPSTAPGAPNYYVPAGFNMWPINTDGSTQKVTDNTFANTLYSTWGFGLGQTFRNGNAQTVQDTTGAGWDQSKYVISQSSSTTPHRDSAEYRFAPSTTGPMLSGAIAEGNYDNLGDRSNPNIYTSREGAYILDTAKHPKNYNMSGNDVMQNLPAVLYPASTLSTAEQVADWPGGTQPLWVNFHPYWPIGKDSWQAGFTRCDACDLFFFSSASADGGNAVNLSRIAPMVRGNDTVGKEIDCGSSFFDPSYILETDNVGVCPAANALNCPGVDIGCIAPYQCRCRCQGNDYYVSRYSFQGVNEVEKTPDEFCELDQCSQNFKECQSTADTIVYPDAMTINANQIVPG